MLLDELEIFPAGLQEDVVKSATAVPVHSALNISHIGISTIYIIEGITSQYIMRTVTTTVRGGFSIGLSFCAVFLPKDIPDCFEFSPIPKSAVWTWRLTKFPLCCRSELILQWKSVTSFSAMDTFPINPNFPCATKLLELWRFSRAFCIRGCYNKANST